MAVRILFAVLALFFILWLIRLWLNWDSTVPVTEHLREKLKAGSSDADSRNSSSSDGSRQDANANGSAATLAGRGTEKGKAGAQTSASSGKVDNSVGSSNASSSNAGGSNAGGSNAGSSNAGNNTAVASDGSKTQGAASGESAPRKPLYQAPAEKDDLKLVKGIGPVMESTLNELGVTTFKQLANFEQSDIDMVTEAIDAFPGRIERDDWVGKARVLEQEKNG